VRRYVSITSYESIEQLRVQLSPCSFCSFFLPGDVYKDSQVKSQQIRAAVRECERFEGVRMTHTVKKSVEGLEALKKEIEASKAKFQKLLGEHDAPAHNWDILTLRIDKSLLSLKPKEIDEDIVYAAYDEQLRVLQGLVNGGDFKESLKRIEVMMTHSVHLKAGERKERLLRELKETREMCQ
jgi:hypothetical protein